MAKKIKNKLKGTETRADIWDKIGGAGGGARRTLKKAKKKSPEISRSEKETGVSHAEAEKLYGDWLKMSPKNKDFIKRVDQSSRKNMKKMMKSPDYGKKYTFSKKLKKMVGLK
jgi:hypothetical protein